MNIVSKDTAILITAYTGGNDPVYHSCGDNQAVMRKRMMTKTLVKYLKETGYYICLSAHSTIDEETQNMCNTFIYDSDNRWQIDGVQIDPIMVLQKFSDVQNGLNVLSRYGFKNVLKLCYDQHPDLDYPKLIKKFEALNKGVVTLQDNYGIGTMCFFGNIQFVKNTLSMNEIWRCEDAVERAWLASIRDKGLADQIYGYTTYDEMLELPPNSVHHFASMDGNKLHDYNY